MKVFKNILEVAGEYKGFILDVWGVLHASGVVFDGVLDSLNALKQDGKKVLLLSNAPRRASTVSLFLAEKTGIIEGKHYDSILTSGEVFFMEIERGEQKKIFYIGPERDLGFIKSTKVELVEDSKECDFAVVTGIVEEPDAILNKLKSNNKKLYCINPDIFVTKSDGSKEECAGFIAEKFRKLGGEVVYFGKPYAPVYEEAMKFFKGLHKSQILAVGDGMETDISGAQNFGIHSALCLSGLPGPEIKRGVSLPNFLSKFDAKPNFVIKSL